MEKHFLSKIYLKRLITFYFALVVCSITYGASTNDICSSGLKSFLSTASAVVTSDDNFPVIKKFVGEFISDHSVKQKYIEKLSKFNIDLQEWNVISNNPRFRQKMSMDEFSNFINYLEFISTLNKKKHALGISGISDFFTLQPKNKIVVEYSDILKKTKEYEKRLYLRELKKVSKRFSHEDSKAVQKIAKENTEKKTKRFREIQIGCRSGIKTPAQSLISKKTRNLFMVSGFGLYTLAYTQKYWEYEKNTKWFAQLAWDLGLIVTYWYVASKILTNPGNSFMGKSIKNYLFAEGLYIGPSFLYGRIFGVSDEIAKKHLEKIKNSKSFAEDLNRLVKTMKDQGKVEKHKEKLIEVISKKIAQEKSVIAASIKGFNVYELATLYMLFVEAKNVDGKNIFEALGLKGEHYTNNNEAQGSQTFEGWPVGKVNELAAVYSLLYGVPKQKAKTILIELFKDPEVLEKVREIISGLEQIPDGSTDTIKSDFIKMLDQSDYFSLKFNVEKLNTLDKSDVNELNDFFLEAAQEDLYWNRDAVFKTGDLGMDRQLVYFGIDAIKVPIEVAMGMLIHQKIVCLKQDNPLIAYSISFAIFASYKYLADLALHSAFKKFAPPLLDVQQ